MAAYRFTYITNIDNAYRNLVADKFDFVTNFLDRYRYYENRFTDQEVDNLVCSLIGVLDAPCDYLKTAGNVNLLYEHPKHPPPSYFVIQNYCKLLICRKINEKYGLQFEKSNFKLWKAHILEGDIQTQTKRGQAATVSVKIEGETNHAFLDLLIVDPDNKQLWYPDPSTWDSNTDTGKLNLMYQKHCSRWTYNISTDSKLGEYKALILLYEDMTLDSKVKDIPEKKREILDFEEKKFNVIG